MNHTPEALQLANQLEANYAHVYAGLAPAAAAALRSQHARIADLEAENKGLRILASGGMELFERYSTFKAKCEELEAMLDAVGAGGVGQSIKPQIQSDTAQEPVAWRVHPFDYGVGSKGVYALTMLIEQVEMWKRKGWEVEPLYTAPQPARQPLTEEQIISIVRIAPALDTVEAEFLHIARTVEAAHGITGGQQ